LDWLPAKLADLILLDTFSHIEYFAATFGIAKNKFQRILVGTDDSELYFDPTLAAARDFFLVHFHGGFLPLQGIEFIVGAAKILESENIRFNIIGRGQEYNKIKALAKESNVGNIEFIEPVPYQRLRQYISAADICLGIFGQSAKTGRVIPNKVYEAAACGKAIVSARGPAIIEVFTDRENIILCRAADENDLAAKILELKNDQDLKNQVGESALKLYREKLTPLAVTHDLFDKFKIWLKQ
jgi:glycosyltransferase involved in cell wall biosynthesis